MNISRKTDVLLAVSSTVELEDFRHVAERAGCNARYAANIADALDLLADDLGAIGVVIVDVELGGGDGLDVIRALRYLDPLHQIRAIARATHQDEQTRTACIAAGADVLVDGEIDWRVIFEERAGADRRTGRPSSACVDFPEQVSRSPAEA